MAATIALGACGPGEGHLPFTGERTAMAVGTTDRLCFLGDSGYTTLVDGVRSSDPAVVEATIGSACAVVEAFTRGTVTVDIWTSRGHVAVVVEAVPAEFFVLRLGTDGRGSAVPVQPAEPFSYGRYWIGLVEWHAGDTVLRGITDTGFSLTDDAVAQLDTLVRQPDSIGGKGGIQLSVSGRIPGMTQLVWNDVPGPVLIVEP